MGTSISLLYGQAFEQPNRPPHKAALGFVEQVQEIGLVQEKGQHHRRGGAVVVEGFFRALHFSAFRFRLSWASEFL